MPKGYAILAALLLALGAFGFGMKTGRNQVLAADLKAERAVVATREIAMQSAAEAIAKIEIKHTTIRQQLETVTREKTFYTTCVSDPAAERVLDDARKDSLTAEPAGSGIVPTP